MSSPLAPLATWITRNRENLALRSDLGRAARCAIALAGPLFLASLPGTGRYYIFACLAAQNIASFDVRGGYRLRIAILISAAFIFAAAAALGAGTGPRLLTVAVTTALVAICTVVIRHFSSDYGPGASVATMVIFVIALALPDNSLTHVWHIALWTLGGGLWGVLVQGALWPIRPEHPLRETVGESWATAANLFTALKTINNATPATDAAAILRQQHFTDEEAALNAALRKTRAALDGARTHRNQAFLRRLEKISSLAGQLSMQAVSAHTALAGAIRRNPALAELAPAFDPILTTLSNTARTVALTVVSRQPSHLALGEARLRRIDKLLAAYSDKIAALRNPRADAPEASLNVIIAASRATVADMLAALRATIDRAAERAAFSLELLDTDVWTLKPFASALNLTAKIDPQLVRFGARITVLAVIGTVVARLSGLPHGYWLVFTLIMLLQPDYGATRQRVAQRLAGTFFGCLVASALLWLPMPHALIYVLVLAAMAAFVTTMRRNYTHGVFFLTIYIVMLVDLKQTVTLEFNIERLVCTLIGGVLALGAAMFFWPLWERARIPRTLSAALSSNLDYWQDLFALIEERRAANAATTAASRRATAANSEVFASLRRMMGDPATQREGLEESAAIANGNQHLTHLLDVIALRLADTKQPAAPPSIPASIAAYGGLGARALRLMSESVLQSGDTAADATRLTACRRDLTALRLTPAPRPSEAETTSNPAPAPPPIAAELARAGTEIIAMLHATEKCLRENVFATGPK